MFINEYFAKQQEKKRAELERKEKAEREFFEMLRSPVEPKKEPVEKQLVRELIETFDRNGYAVVPKLGVSNGFEPRPANVSITAKK